MTAPFDARLLVSGPGAARPGDVIDSDARVQTQAWASRCERGLLAPRRAARTRASFRRFRELFHDCFDRSSSVLLSLAIIWKRPCAFPKAVTVRSDFSKRRRNRSFSARSLVFSTASGLAGLPRFGGAPPASYLRQFASNELYTRSASITAARAREDGAASYSADAGLLVGSEGSVLCFRANFGIR